MWDERYSEEGWAYGVEPNDFVKQVCADMPPGKALCLAEGQGRNAVYLAQLGFDVTALDLSAIGLKGARELARIKGVRIDTKQVDLSDYELGEQQWDLIVAIFAHFPPELRRDVHRRVVRALKPGGHFVLEAYTPDQLKHGTGGPRDEAWLMSVPMLREELVGMEFSFLEEGERTLAEGKHHQGVGATVQLLARRENLPRYKVFSAT